jgi:hypothetical protein
VREGVRLPARLLLEVHDGINYLLGPFWKCARASNYLADPFLECVMAFEHVIGSLKKSLKASIHLFAARLP